MMDNQIQYIFTEALKLPTDMREDLAVRLMGTIEPSEAEVETIRQAWNEEIDRRVAKMERGDAEAIPIEDAWPKLSGRPWQAKSSENG